ncbi:MAG: bifunctional 5,10-methylenetetrahydrofolate dehydrogenase/5,10-methenyltetrahydrofolate cyclohydrolase [Candidatus Omnitrophica bacterium]|nr:bifunctional 5,10-methylenetetrahydrofolate dehydrogenase/5,10-methenyltetrahydrofolate cyclohydrolase [Candidatus Omnitrophota bacterium]
MAKLLEGKVIAERIKEELKQNIKSLKIKPVLASIQVGSSAGTNSYVLSQQRTAQSLGVEYRLKEFGADVSEAELIEFIQKLNSDKTVNGIIVQMPLPQHMDCRKIIQFIKPQKDAEGVHPENIGKVLYAQAKILPCTPAAVMELLKETGIDLYGKEVVVIGHSDIVGRPLALLLLNKFSTVTVCHIATSKAGKLEEHVKRADVLVVAVGKAGLIKGDLIKEGAVVIDVGINRVGGKIVGDVDFEQAQNRASFITPVPGGVGPLTVAMLMRNLIETAKT